MSVQNYDIRFKAGACHCIVAPPASGKTWRLLMYLRNLHFFQRSDQIKTVVLYYSVWQELYTVMQKEGLVTTFKQHYPSNQEFIDTFTEPSNKGQHSIAIFDDCSLHINEDILKIANVSARHLSTTCFFIYQNLFNNDKYSRTLSMSARYMHLLFAKRMFLSVQILFRQIESQGAKWLSQVYEDIMKTPYSCMLIDFSVDCPDYLRYRTGFEQDRPVYVYIKKGTSIL